MKSSIDILQIYWPTWSAEHLVSKPNYFAFRWSKHNFSFLEFYKIDLTDYDANLFSTK